MLGYSDDNWVLAPSIDALQEMMTIIERYCSIHNLKFSTDSDPSKCKTKCIAFLRKDRPLPSIILSGNRLPWVSSGVHLGNNFDCHYDGMCKDIAIKRAAYVQKNCEIIQEFYFAHPKTKLHINNVYNCNFTESPLWNLFGFEARKLEKTWNVSIRQMFDLPRETHRYLVEPVSEYPHLRKILMCRFISFLNQVNNSGKNVPKDLLNTIQYDTKSITGNNIRNILRLTKKVKIEDVKKQDILKLDYFTIPEGENWRLNLIRDIVETQNSVYEIQDFSVEELKDMLAYACTS